MSVVEGQISEGPDVDGGTGLNTGSTVLAGTAGVHIVEMISEIKPYA